MNAYIFYAFAVVSVLLGPASREARPDFSGTWSVVAVRPAPESSATALPPPDLTIRQTPTALSISRTVFDRTITDTYFLDGRESTNRSGAMTRVTNARWDGTRLVISGKASQVTSQGYAAWTTTEIYSLTASGHLEIESDYISAEGRSTKSVQELVRKNQKRIPDGQ